MNRGKLGRVQWRALENAVMNLCVSIKSGEQSTLLPTFQRKPCTVKLVNQTKTQQFG